ncbi:DNA-3-methyladenine glycosylase family protein [Roseomonas rosulenta]|uniref:DNA-3-methyladenine glycosylase family protein n=1 Tax=Roseomonas rosulenta TaxID=2748667 RepID=UPI0018DF0CDD|nr:DNA-3-methyladenine glycosylase 2 family protein [Roseomonas rosulenta]
MAAPPSASRSPARRIPRGRSSPEAAGVTPPSPAPAASPPVPDWAREAILALGRLDPDFAGIEDRAGPLPWRRRDPGFAGLLRTICGQMISNQAAAAIWGRLSALPGALDPAGLLALDDAALRGAGLSRPKVSHVRALAGAVLDGRLDFAALRDAPDDAAVAAISAIPGLGPWTAQVHLVFGFERPDVFPAGDIALAAGVAHLKFLPDRPKPRALAEIALAWSPHRSLAARLLWHHWRHATGRPAGEAP